jgi:hypothetical protein
VGRSFDGDGKYGPQCKDFVNAYAEFLGHPLKSSNAAETWYKEQDTFWQKIPFEESFIPKLGDIVIWGPWKNNQYGHIAVVSEASQAGFKSFDQNWETDSETRSSVAVIEHNYKSPAIIGYLSPSL